MVRPGVVFGLRSLILKSVSYPPAPELINPCHPPNSTAALPGSSGIAPAFFPAFSATTFLGPCSMPKPNSFLYSPAFFPITFPLLVFFSFLARPFCPSSPSGPPPIKMHSHLKVHLRCQLLLETRSVQPLPAGNCVFTSDLLCLQCG